MTNFKNLSIIRLLECHKKQQEIQKNCRIYMEISNLAINTQQCATGNTEFWALLQNAQLSDTQVMTISYPIETIYICKHKITP